MDEKKVSAWLKQSIQYLGAALTAAGVTIGAQVADGSRTATLERRVAENDKADEVAHGDCARFRTVDLSGFTDPRTVYAIDQAIQRVLRDYETRERATAWRRRLRELNPTLKILDE